jgi:hypothetical protein
MFLYFLGPLYLFIPMDAISRVQGIAAEDAGIEKPE